MEINGQGEADENGRMFQVSAAAAGGDGGKSLSAGQFFFTSCLSLQRPTIKCSLLLGSPPAIYLSVRLPLSSQR